MSDKDEWRSVPITTRVTKEQKEVLDALAKKAGISLSDYMLAGRIELIKIELKKKTHVE